MRQTNQQKTYLFEYAKDGNANNFFKNLTQQQLNMLDGYKKTPLHYLCQHAHIDIILKLGQQYNLSETVNKQDEYGYTPMLLAFVSKIPNDSRDEHLQMIEMLVNSGGSLSQAPKGEMNCLHWACYHQNPDLIYFILKRQPHLTLIRDDAGNLPVDLLFRLPIVPKVMDIFEEMVELQIQQGVEYKQKIEVIECSPQRKNIFRSPSGVQGDNTILLREPIPNQLNTGIVPKIKLRERQSKKGQANGIVIHSSKAILIQKQQKQQSTSVIQIKLPQFNFGYPLNNGNEENLFSSRNNNKSITKSKKRKYYEQSVNNTNTFIVHESKPDKIHEITYANQRYLYWSSFLNRLDYVFQFLKLRANPFENHCKNALHIAAEKGNYQVT